MSVDDRTRIAASELIAGLVLGESGDYVLEGSAALRLPIFPTDQSWPVWFEARPCVLRIDASDVTLDLGGFELSVANDQPQGAVLIGVKAGASNVTVKNGALGRSSVGLFFALRCRAGSASDLSIRDFAESGLTAYSPQGFALRDVTIGPNLIALGVSQETFALQAYGAAVSSAVLEAWRANPDNLAVQEVSHLTGVAIVPDAAGDAPNYPFADTSTEVVLQNVSVGPLQMYYREHSIRLGVTSQGVARLAVGSFEEPLAEVYDIRLAAAKKLGVGYLPSLDCAPSARHANVGGLLLNVGDGGLGLAEAATAWLRGVDRDGGALRGAQAVLLVGCGAAILTDVSAAMPSVTPLPPRVSLRPGGCQIVSLMVSTRAMALVELPAPPARACCPKKKTWAAGGYFGVAGQRVRVGVRPTSPYMPQTSGSYIVR